MMHHTLRCLDTGETLEDDGTILSNPNSRRPALLRADYGDRPLKPGPASDGVYRFVSWLPVRRRLPGSSAPVTYLSEGLGPRLGLRRLAITFSGYWPQRNVKMRTGTFKETEAYGVCARLPQGIGKTLVVASAGNTARAFINVCSVERIPLCVVVPEDALPSIWRVTDRVPEVRVVAVRNADYFTAIDVSNAIASLPGFIPEGGAKNVARRDGMGTTALSAATFLGEIPQYYFQAVGSGTGAIAAWEANLRLIAQGGYGTRKMRLMLSQNAPFTPLVEAWAARSRDLPNLPESDQLAQISEIDAKVLANRKPPYGLIGGLYDALSDTDGRMFAVTNEDAKRAAELFEDAEGIDPSPAASVAVASLIEAARSGDVDPDSLIMLNVTGGGIKLLRQELRPRPVTPDVVVGVQDRDSGRLAELIGA